MERRGLAVERWVSRWVAFAVLAACVVAPAPPAHAEDAVDEVSKYTQALASGDEKARIAAIDALARMGPQAKDAVGHLAAQLGDSSPAVRAHAAYALMKIGAAAAPASAALTKALSDPDFHVRRMAIAALERIRPEPKGVVEALGQALEDAHPSVRVAALHTLTEYGEAAVPELTRALKDPDTAYWAALALGELGPAAKGATAALAAALDDKNAQVRREALLALARIGPEAAEAVAAITPCLEDPDPSVRYAAGFALGSMGPAAVGALDALRKEQHHDDLEHCVACWALARIEPENKEARAHAIEMLLATVKDKNPRVQSAAVRGLLDLQAPPEQLVPALGQVIQSGQEPAVGEALAALATMSDEAVPVLAEALENRPEARARAAMLVTYLGPKAKEAVPALVAALADENAAVRREVLFALAAIGADAAGAAGAIQKSLADPDTRNRATAAFALGRIGPSAAAAVPALQEELTSPDPLARVASAYGLVFVAPDNEAIARQALPVLMQGLQNPLPAARRGAAEALGHLGKRARGAEGALRMATHDPDESVRKAALEALEKMGAVVDAPPQQSAKPRKRD